MTNTNHTSFILFININSTNHPNNTNLLHYEPVLVNNKNLALVERLTVYITLVVSIIGIIGNGCTIIILNRHSMRRWRSSMILSALATADFLYLLIIFLSIIDTLTYQIIGLHRSLLLCHITVYITHVCSFLSANFTLSFTLQRFVVVFFPLHANTMISNHSSIINILSLVFLSCGFYSFSFCVTSISNGQCQEDENHSALYSLLIVDICLTFVLPFIFIFFLNLAIVYKLKTKDFSSNLGKIITETRVSKKKKSAFFLVQKRISSIEKKLCMDICLTDYSSSMNYVA